MGAHSLRRRPALPGKPALSTQFLLISAVDLALLLYVIQAHRAANWQPFAAWLLAVGLLLAAARQLDQEQADVAPLALAWDRWDTFALVGLTGVALLLRIIWLERLPLTMHNDEAVMALAAQELRQGGVRGWYLLDTFGHSQLWYALLHGSMRLFGPSLFGLRMVAVIFGAATMGTTYLLVRLLFNRPLALLSTLLLATFHFHVHFSRIGLNNVTDTFFGTLVALLLAAGLRQGSRFLLAATGVTLGIALHFYTGARLLVPLTLFMGGTWYVDQWRHRGTRERDPLPALAAAVMGGTAALYTLMPFAFAVLQDPWPFMKRFSRDGVTLAWVNQQAASLESSPWSVMWTQFKDATLGFVLVADKDVGRFYDHQQALLTGPAAWLAVAGLLIALWRVRQWRYQWLLGWLGLTILLGGTLMRNPPAVQRYVTVAAALCIFMALPLAALYRGLTTWRPRDQRAWLALVLGVALIPAGMSINTYFHDYAGRNDFGTYLSAASTALVHYLADQPSNVDVWYVGEEAHVFAESQIMAFAGRKMQHLLMQPENVAMDPYDELANLPEAQPARAMLFIAGEDQRALLQAIASQIPGGQWEAVHWPLREAPIFFAYLVPAIQAEQQPAEPPEKEQPEQIRAQIQQRSGAQSRK